MGALSRKRKEAEDCENRQMLDSKLFHAVDRDSVSFFLIYIRFSRKDFAEQSGVVMLRLY